MKHRSHIAFLLLLLTNSSFSQLREKPIIADYVPNIPEELIEAGKLSKFVALSVPDDERWNPENNNLNANSTVFAFGQNSNDFLHYLGGHFDTIGGFLAKRIARFQDNHSQQPTFEEVGGGIEGGDVYSILETDNEDVYVSGNFLKAGTTPVHNIAHWTGSQWEDLKGGTDGSVFAMALYGTLLYVGGNFTHAGGKLANYIAIWDTVSRAWYSVFDDTANGLNGGVFTLALDEAGSLYVGGGFTRAGTVAANKIAVRSGTTWNALQSGVEGSNAAVYKITSSLFGGIYVGGQFTLAGGIAINNLAFWSGKNWSKTNEFPNGLDGPVYAINDVSLAGKLYVGGNFHKSGDSLVNFIAKSNQGMALGSGLNGPCYALQGRILIVDVGNYTNHIYAGGAFTDAGTKPSANFAIWGEPGGGSVPTENIAIHSVNISPNPLSSSGTISFTLSSSAKISEYIIDQLGRKVIHIGTDWCEAGQSERTFRVNDLPPGAYYFRIESPLKSASVPFIILR